MDIIGKILESRDCVRIITSNPEVIYTNPFSGQKIFIVRTTCTWKTMTYPTKTNAPMELTEDTLEEMYAAFESGCDTFHAPW